MGPGGGGAAPIFSLLRTSKAYINCTSKTDSNGTSKAYKNGRPPSKTDRPNYGISNTYTNLVYYGLRAVK